MNLFIVGWNLPAPSRALAGLQGLGAVYPQIDSATLWHASPHPGVFAACMSTGRKPAAPRRYVAEDERHVALFDGCLIDREGRFDAHDAGALLAHWEELADRLEGQFGVFRIGRDAPLVEMITDPLGYEQVYYAQHAETWIMSNSVGLIARTVEAGGLDVRGASQLLTMGWVGADRTLRAGVRVVPAGQIWRWLPGRGAPERRSHYPRARLMQRRRGTLRPEALSRLASELVSACQILNRAYGDLRCAITAGRDSRLIAALLRQGGVPARYYTSGAPGSIDIELAARVAARLGVAHEVEIMTDAEVIAGWEAACRGLIRQNDGMVNLIQAADLVRQPARIERLKLILWGDGAAVARSAYFHPGVVIRRPTWRSMKSFFTDILVDDHCGLLRPPALEESRALLGDFIDEMADEGFSLLDVPDLFYTYDRLRRWGGANARKAMPAGERFSPFCTRAFLEAAFALSPLQRYSEPLHYRLMQRLAPDLDRIPYDTGPWRSQRPALTLVRWLAREAGRRGLGLLRGRSAAPVRVKLGGRILTFDHAAWLETKREWWRGLCLDRPASPIWSLADRRVFERLAAPETPENERRRRTRGLYNLITLFAHEAECTADQGRAGAERGAVSSPMAV